ncbi:MAG: UDP-N-acetylmuramoyl-L-alanine--D-glutamate ligase [Acidobacteriota bacterium]
MKDYKGMNVLILGFGKSGEESFKFLLKRGATITVSDVNENIIVPDEYLKENVKFVFGPHKVEDFINKDMIVVSPGVSWDVEPLRVAREKGIRVIPEVQLAYENIKGNIIGITGSNGKSTTAALVHKILNYSGIPAFLAGNIGYPLVSFVDKSSEKDLIVTELSSFQLEGIENFRIKLSSILNITPDHLDRHRSFEEYVMAKKRIFLFQTKEDFSLFNSDDPVSFSLSKESRAKLMMFSRERVVEYGSFVRKEKIIFSDGIKEREIITIKEIPLKGIHNLENVLAAVPISALFVDDDEKIRNAIADFRGLEHRMEFVDEINGVEFYNDSKATNVDAALKSLQSFEKKVVAILGGRDKAGDFTKLRETVRGSTKAIILIGEARDKIRKALNGTTSFFEGTSMDEAVEKAYELSLPGDVVLLAPACASFDMFKNFEDRGMKFKESVFKLKRRGKTF